MIHITPSRIRLLLTASCNAKCFYCHNEGQAAFEKMLVDHLFVKNLLEMVQTDCVVISGGEPTLNQEVVNIAREVKKRGIVLKINTNGYNPKIISDIANYTDQINISIDSVDSDAYKNIKGMPLDNAMQSLLLAREKTKVRINCPLVSIKDAMNLVKFGEESKIEIKFFEVLNTDFSKPDLGLESLRSLLIDGGYAAKQGDTITEQLTKDDYTVYLSRCHCRVAFLLNNIKKAINFCREKTDLVITPSGKLKPCLYGNKEIDIYDLVMRKDENSLSEKFNEFDKIFGLGSCQKLTVGDNTQV